MIKVKLEGVEEALKQFDPKTVQRAARMAINDAARQTRTEAQRGIRDVWNLKADRVRKEVTNLSMASNAKLEATISAQGRPIGLPNFGAKWIRNVNGQARTTTKDRSTISKRMAKQTGVRVTIEKGTTTMLSKAFMAPGRRGTTYGAGALLVFVRSGPGRNAPLINKATVTIATMFGQPRVMERATKRAQEVLARRFQYHIDRQV